MDSYQIALVAITLCAAIVNGALGVRLLIDHGSAGAPLPDQPGAQPGARADRGRAERLRPLGQSVGAGQRLAPRPPHRHRPASRVLVGTCSCLQVNPGWLKFGTFIALLRSSCFRRPATEADSIRAVGRAGVRRRRRPALFRHDHFGPAARGDAQQPGPHQAGLPRRVVIGSPSLRSPQSPTTTRVCIRSRAWGSSPTSCQAS